MVYEYMSFFIGVIKIFIYKVLNFNKIKFKTIPKMNHSFKIAIKKKSKIYFGKNFRCRNNVSFRCYGNGNIYIGDNVFMNDGCSINCQKKISIGNNVILGQNVLIFDHDHDYKNNIKNFVKKDVTIGSNVWIGANVIILKGVSIGNNVVIGAGTVVNKDLEDNTLLYQEKNNITKKVIQ